VGSTVLSLVIWAVPTALAVARGGGAGGADFVELRTQDAAEVVGGAVISLEIEPERTAQARENLQQAGVDGFVELRTEDAGEALRAFADEAFDLIVLDAERPHYVSYWPDLVRTLRPRGLLVVDNTLSHARELVDFSELVYSADGVTSTLVTVGAGVLLIVKSA
jgi:predicted O-methyltransferase YrrM